MKNKSEYFSHLNLTFFGGFLVMALELCAFRVLATYFGSSIYVTGTLLTMIMIALSAGYYLGGRLSKRKQAMKVLMGMLLVCSAYIAIFDIALREQCLDFILKAFGISYARSVFQQTVPPIFASLILFGAPIFILGQISPFVIQEGYSTRQGLTPTDAGSYSGLIMATSTVGSILGTLLTSFVFIPRLGIQHTLTLALILLVLSTLFSIYSLKVKLKNGTFWILGLLSIYLVSFFLTFEQNPDPSVLYLGETSYGSVKIYERYTADHTRYIGFSPMKGYYHTLYYPEDPLKNQYSLSHLTPAVIAGAQSYLILGTAGGGEVPQIRRLNPNAQITAVDIDGDVLSLSQKYFGLDANQNLKLIEADAKAYLATTTDKFDAILVDLYAGNFIPTHCITREFFELARARLSEKGILYLNTNMRDFPFVDAQRANVFSPLHHLEATLFQAGFKTIFENSIFHGLYAFQTSVSLQNFLGDLQTQYSNRNHPAALRTALATLYLNATEAPLGRAQLRPYTDDWVPEHWVHLKSNSDQFTQALASALSQPDLSLSQHASPLEQESAVAIFEASKKDTKGRELPFLSPLDCDRYFQRASSLLTSLTHPRTELAKFFLLGCDFSRKLRPGISPEALQLAAYNEALNLADEDRYAEALPLFDLVISAIQD